MDEFDKLATDRIYQQRKILKAVDEYTLYCFYSDIEDIRPGRVYRSPLRDDVNPSFVFYETRKFSDCEYLWKDMATGDSGSIFKLVKLRFGLSSYREVYALIAKDFALDEDIGDEQVVNRIALYTRPPSVDVKIEPNWIPFNEKGLAYWNQWRIKEDLLSFFDTFQTDAYWTNGIIHGVLDPTFVYRIGEYYQLYSPYASREFKFRNDLPEEYFFGYLQLPEKGKKLIIDKSSKDVIFDRVLGLYAVAGKSESTLIPHHKMIELKDRFEEIYLTLDPDAAGRKQTEKYMSMYPWLKPRFLDEAKDKTDLALKVGFDKAKETIYKLVEYE